MILAQLNAPSRWWLYFHQMCDTEWHCSWGNPTTRLTHSTTVTDISAKDVEHNQSGSC